MEAAMIKCEHGCGQEAKFVTKGGKNICSKSANSCPSNRQKNRNSVLRAYQNGLDPVSRYQRLSQETKDKMAWNRGARHADFSYGGKGQHKNALVLERGHRCESCKLDKWLEKPITLELEHVDGDRKNNTRKNLKLLCPNCHSQTPTWRRGNGKSGWKRKRYTDEQMIEVIKSSTCLNQVLEKLDLRYGSAKTIISVMSKYKISYADVV